MKNKTRKIAAAAMALALLGTGNAVYQIHSPSTNTTLTASAASYNEVIPSWDKLEVSKVVEGVTLDPKKDEIWVCSFKISNNKGLAIWGGSAPFDSNCFELIIKDNKPISELGKAGKGLVWHKSKNINDIFIYNEEQCQGFNSLVGASCIIADIDDINYNDGVMISFYFKAKKNPKTGKLYTAEKTFPEMTGTIWVDKMLDPKTKPVNHTEPKVIEILGETDPLHDNNHPIIGSSSAILGDVNKDGKIDVEDAQMICNMYKKNNRQAIAVVSEDQAIADIDGNNIIDLSDAEEILDFYTSGGVCYNTPNPKYQIGKSIPGKKIKA